jgi:hypothetical protein
MKMKLFSRFFFSLSLSLSLSFPQIMFSLLFLIVFVRFS